MLSLRYNQEQLLNGPLGEIYSLNVLGFCPRHNHSYCSYWTLDDPIIMHLQCNWWEPKSTSVRLWKNAFKSLSEANMNLQMFKWGQSSRYLSCFSAKVSVFVAILVLQLKRKTLAEETQRENLILRRL